VIRAYRHEDERSSSAPRESLRTQRIDSLIRVASPAMAEAITSVLYTRDQRVFLVDDDGGIREASGRERLTAIADLVLTAQESHAPSDA
jgi:hypothetical protein